MGQNAGAVLVFRYVDGAWDQMGETIFGSSASDNAGRGIAISDDGQKLAVGFPGEATWRGEDYGVVRIYAWDGSSWVQQGSDIYQPVIRSMLNAFGWSIDFNDAGTGVVVSADNYAVIYEFDGTDWAEHSQQLSARRAYVEWRGDHLVTGGWLYRWRGTDWVGMSSSNGANPMALAEALQSGYKYYRLLENNYLFQGVGYSNGSSDRTQLLRFNTQVSNGINWQSRAESMDARGGVVLWLRVQITPGIATVVAGVIDIYDQFGSDSQWTRVSRLVGGTAEKLGIGYTDMSWDGSRFVTSTGTNVVRVYELQEGAAYGLDSDNDGAPDTCDFEECRAWRAWILMMMETES